MILFRTQELGERSRHFAAELAAASGLPLACLVDERTIRVDSAPWPKVSLNEPNCASLGLFCPPDLGWRCGDYGFYLAQQQFPDAPYFWMIEYDVRFGGNVSDFFAMFANRTADLLAADFRSVSEDWWYWEHTIAARNLTPYRCLFPILRLSARAVRKLSARRAALSRRWIRRQAWPNDESFVATALANDPDMVCRDFNDFGRELYSSDTFSFESPFDGDELGVHAEMPLIYHPVLFGDAYRSKLARMGEIRAGEATWTRRRRRLIEIANRRLTW